MKISWNDRLLRRIFVTMFTFSFFSLMYVGLFPDVASTNFGISENQKLVYGLLYGAWALGASLGALTVGTFLAHHSKAVITRWSLAAVRGAARRLRAHPFAGARVRRVARARASPTSSSSRRCRRCCRSISTTPCAAGSWRCG